MRSYNHGRLQQQTSFLRRQFLQDGDLPFTNVLSEGIVSQALIRLSQCKCKAPQSSAEPLFDRPARLHVGSFMRGLMVSRTLLCPLWRWRLKHFSDVGQTGTDASRKTFDVKAEDDRRD